MGSYRSLFDERWEFAERDDRRNELPRKFFVGTVQEESDYRPVTFDVLLNWHEELKRLVATGH